MVIKIGSLSLAKAAVKPNVKQNNKAVRFIFK